MKLNIQGYSLLPYRKHCCKRYHRTCARRRLRHGGQGKEAEQTWGHCTQIATAVPHSLTFLIIIMSLFVILPICTGNCQCCGNDGPTNRSMAAKRMQWHCSTVGCVGGPFAAASPPSPINAPLLCMSGGMGGLGTSGSGMTAEPWVDRRSPGPRAPPPPHTGMH